MASDVRFTGDSCPSSKEMDDLYSREVICLATQILGDKWRVDEKDIQESLRRYPHNNVCGDISTPQKVQEAFLLMKKFAALAGQAKKEPSFGVEAGLPAFWEDSERRIPFVMVSLGVRKSWLVPPYLKSDNETLRRK